MDPSTGFLWTSIGEYEPVTFSAEGRQGDGFPTTAHSVPTKAVVIN